MPLPLGHEAGNEQILNEHYLTVELDAHHMVSNAWGLPNIGTHPLYFRFRPDYYGAIPRM
jgi:hypothetical protein